jgi:hypothetical protein
MMKITDFRPLLDNPSPEELQASPASTGRELEALVEPISCAEFANTYFARTSLSLEGNAQKFEHIFNWEKLKQALWRGRNISDPRYNIKASFTGGEDSGNPHGMLDANHTQVAELLNAGATICITNIHMADPFLAQWAQAIRAQLNFTGTVGVNCYVSPDGSGLPMHYDKRVATTLQIAGKKRWKFSTEPAKPWPDSNEVYQEGQFDTAAGTAPADMAFREVELQPGDLLCLPAGAWHSARGVGFSLALNLYFAPRNLLDQFMPILQHFAFSNEHWRGGPPATVEKAQGSLPSAVSTYVRERLDEFHRLALEVLASPDLLTVPWLTQLTHAPYTGWQSAPLLSIPEVGPEQRFCIANSALRFIEYKNNLIVPCDNGVLSLPVSLMPILQRLASEPESFTLPDVFSWQQDADGPAPNEIMFFLKKLYENGIIKRA